MASNKKDNQLVTTATDNIPGRTVTYANEVIATIAGIATDEVQGIAGMYNVSQSILSKKSNITKGVKVEIGTEEVSVDLYIIVEYGTPIQKAAQDAQENVRKAIESMTGLHVVRVDVHVQGVSFEKENKSMLDAGTQTVALDAGTKSEQKETEVPATEPVQEEKTEEKSADAQETPDEAAAEEAAEETAAE